MNNLARHLRGILFLLAALSNLTISANPGTVLSWGQLELPFPITNAIAISVKNAVAPGPNAVALRADGTVVTWGNGSHGLASPPDDLTNAVAVAAGGAHIVALRRDGTVVCWGRNSNGEAATPLGLSNVVAISAGFTHSLALRADGTLQAWGDLGVPEGLSNVVSISSGIDHNLAVRSDGTVVGWGAVNQWGQADPPVGLSNVVAVAAGRMHSLALKADGSVVAWGNSFLTPLPDGLSNVIALAAGGSQSLALRSDHSLVAWGFNSFGVPGQTNLLAIASADDVNLALTLQPVFVAQPGSFSAPAGTSAALSVEAIASSPVTFQWRRNGQDILGATNASLQFNNLQSGDSANYDVVASSMGGNLVSGVASVAVAPSLPNITEQPISQDVRSGDAVNFGVKATGSEPFRYQWFLNGAPLAEKTNSVLTIANASTINAGRYYVAISNDQGTSSSAEAMLTVHDRPVVSNVPVNLALLAGMNRILAVTAEGEPPLRYQWQLNGSDLSGATQAGFELKSVTMADAGDYSVIVRNDYWSVTNLLYVVTVGESGPVIVTGPATQKCLPQGTAVLRVQAYGSAPLAFQWSHDGVAIPGATNAVLTLTNFSAGATGRYWVKLSNHLGETNSAPAELSMGDPYPGQIDPPLLNFTQVVSNSFLRPTVMTHAGDNSGRLFIGEQSGIVRIIRSGEVQTQRFLDISDRVLVGGERGLLGLAFSRHFAANGQFYVNYTRKPDGASVIARYRVIQTGDNAADASTEEVLLTVPQPFANHKGGQLAFGPDGYLYVGLGDGGSAGDPNNNAQNTALLLGKILRLEVEGGTPTYAVPTSNPFVSRPGFAPEIWALGLRNPWRFSFDRLTGDLFIADVGERRWEEINVQPAASRGGENYGWRIREGNSNFVVPPEFTDFAKLTEPVISYDRSQGGSVIGGYVYRGPNEPRMNGMYFYSDFVSRRFWGMKPIGTNWQSILLTQAMASSSFGENELGELFVADYYQGGIYQLRDTRRVATPTFSPTGGTITSNFLTVACSTPGALIHYSNDGREPTEADPGVPSGTKIAVLNNRLLQARAFRLDLEASEVARATFTLKVAAPTMSPVAGPITNGTQVLITSETPECTIHYTLDGSIPDRSSPVYSVPLKLNGGTTLTARAFRQGFEDSDPIQTVFDQMLVATPEISVFSEPITNQTPVTITCATPGAAIFYTLDGSDPTPVSRPYLQAFLIDGNTTVKAAAFLESYAPSLISSHFFELVTVSQPEFSPFAGPITNNSVVTVSCSTPGAVIHYTLDDSVPGPSSPVYVAPLVLPGNVTLSARAFRPGYNDSPVQSTRFNLIQYEATVVWTLAGTGLPAAADGLRAAAAFNAPEGLWLKPQTGEIFVADTGNHKIRKILPSGEVVTVAGTGAPGFVEGNALEAQFNEPSGICGDTEGNLYVADRNNGHRIRKISANGVVSTYATVRESYFGPGLAQLEIDSAGRLFVGNWSLVTMVTGPEQGHTIAGSENSGAIFGWSAPIGLGVDAENHVLATTLNRIVKITPDGPQEDYAGSQPGFADGPRLQALFERPRDLTVGPGGTIYVSDSTRIRKISPAGLVSTLAGVSNAGYRNGPGPFAAFNLASGVCVDLAGNVYVADTLNHCLRVVSGDADSDGIPDFKEGPATPFVVGVDDRLVDSDHDGLSNSAEFQAGTNPRDSSSLLAIDAVVLLPNADVEIRWRSVPGVSYLLMSSDDLVTWNPVGGKLSASGTTLTVIDSAFVENGLRMYRVSVADVE